MDTLAFELITLISFFACTDGGQTACALSLVSKHIRAASRPARFYSVALVSSPAQLAQFLKCYEAERERSPNVIVPRVRHLCLSLFGDGLDTSGASTQPAANAPPTTASASTLALAGQPTSRAEFLAAMQRRAQHWRSTQHTLDDQYNNVVPALIHAVAADVESLALVQAQWRSTSVVRCCFPRLRELSLVGGDPGFLPLRSIEDGIRPFPALERLHHIFAFASRDVDFTQWARHAPNVTHLRVSRLDYDPPIAVESFKQVLLGEGHFKSGEPFFPLLQHATILPHRMAPSRHESGAALARAHLANEHFLLSLRYVAEKARVPVTLLPAEEVPKTMSGRKGPHAMCIVRLKGEWMDRIEGRPGCWI